MSFVPSHRTAGRLPRMVLLCVLGAVGLSGCVLVSETRTSASDNERFIGMWQTYQHCRSSTVPHEIRADLGRLTALTREWMERDQTPSFLPVQLRSFVSIMPLRLAVDPYALTMACARHAREVAETPGDPDVERALLIAVARVVHLEQNGGRDHGL